MLEIQANTAILFYRKLRQIISYHQVGEIFGGCIELNEGYFGGVYKGKSCRGVGGKVAVLSILKRGSKVLYIVLVTKTKATT